MSHTAPTRKHTAHTSYATGIVLAGGPGFASFPRSVSTIGQDWEPDSTSVNAVAAGSPEWPYGEVHVRSSSQIGAGYGLSGGDVYRIEASGEHACSFSFIVKREGADAVARALAFHRTVGARAAPAIPVCLGGHVDAQADIGLLLLEDVAPSEQGDVLRGCTDARALAAVRSLAHVHAAAFNCDAGALARITARWQGRAAEPREWDSRLSAATTRFPQVLTPELVRQLKTFPRRIHKAIESLRTRAASVIHSDAHLDNVLFRPDGSAVILDWSGAALGPAAIDLARLLTEGVNAGARQDLTRSLVTAYVSEWQAAAGAPLVEDLWEGLSSGLALLTQSALGWAAREEHREPGARMRTLQENILRSVCAWMHNSDMTKPGRIFA